MRRCPHSALILPLRHPGGRVLVLAGVVFLREVDLLPEVIDVLVDLGDGLELLWLARLVHLARGPLDALALDLLPGLLLAPAV